MYHNQSTIGGCAIALFLILVLLLLASLIWTVPLTLGMLVVGRASPLLVLLTLYGAAILGARQIIRPSANLPGRLKSLLLLLSAFLLLRGVELRLIPLFMPYTPFKEVLDQILFWISLGAIPLAGLGAFVTARSRLVITLVAVLLLLFGPLTPRLRNLFVLPVGLSGEVTIETGDPSCAAPGERGGFRRFEIPASGELCNYLPESLSMLWCSADACSNSAQHDQWVYVGQESKAMRTGGSEPEIYQIEPGGCSSIYHGGQRISHSCKIRFRVR